MACPRPLRPKERDLLELVLPVDRPGYRAIREVEATADRFGITVREPFEGQIDVEPAPEVPRSGGPLSILLNLFRKRH